MRGDERRKSRAAQGTCAGYRHRGLDAAWGISGIEKLCTGDYPGHGKTRGRLPGDHAHRARAREKAGPCARSRHGAPTIIIVKARFPFRGNSDRPCESAAAPQLIPNLLTDKLVAGGPSRARPRDSRRVRRNEPPNCSLGPERSFAAMTRIPDAQPGPRLHPRAAARQCLGSATVYIDEAHRRCPMSGRLRKGPLRRNRFRPDPHRARARAMHLRDKGPAANLDHFDFQAC